MRMRTIALATAVLAGGLQAGASTASAAAFTQRAPDAYGHFVNTTHGSSPSSTAILNYLTWDSNGYNVTVQTQLRDTGFGDGQLAGLYAILYYTDGSNSGLKTVDESGDETTFPNPNGSRAFVPSKRVSGVSLVACRRSTAAGINACGTSSPIWDNPYT